MIAPVEISELLELPDELLFRSSERLRNVAFGNRMEFCAIINIRSGRCAMDCKFCSQSDKYQTNIARHGLLTDEQLLEKINELLACPVAHIGLVASGSALQGPEFERLLLFVSGLAPQVRAKICLSLGKLSKGQLAGLKDAGITRYHHNLETSQDFYPRICSTQSWRARLRTIENALALGLEICAGGIFGIGESWFDRYQLANVLASLPIASMPINFLHPQPGTPLENRKILDAREALRIIAIFRHILPNTTLRLCGGRLKSLGDSQHKIYRAGINAVMSGNFLTTKGAAFLEDIATAYSENMRITPNNREDANNKAIY